VADAFELSRAIKRGFERLGFGEALLITEARRTILGRARITFVTPLIGFPLPNGGTWIARMCWEGPADLALMRLAALPDETTSEGFWKAFHDWFPDSSYWPDGWREALQGEGKSQEEGEK
jgi:hypothetical protein